MDNIEYRFINTKEEIYRLIVDQTRNIDLSNLEIFTTTNIYKNLNVSRNLASQYLNDFFKVGKFIKINSRPVYFFDKKSLLDKYNLKNIKIEYDDLNQFVNYLKEHYVSQKNFGKAIGHNLGLRSVVEKCIIAMDYPPHGLSVMLRGEGGVGKSYLSYLTYEYACDSNLIGSSFKYVVFNCLEYENNYEKAEIELIGDGPKNVVGLMNSDVFLYIKDFHLLNIETQRKIVNYINNCKARIVFSSTNDILDESLVVQQKIPILVDIPPLSSRSIAEKESLIINFIKQESFRIQKPIEIIENAYSAILEYKFMQNIRELKDCIQRSCAKAFSINKEKSSICITLLCLPENMLKRVNVKMISLSEKNKILNLKDIVTNIDFEREEKLYDGILRKFHDYNNHNKIDFDSFCDESAKLIDSYHENIIFNKDLANERGRLIEQIIIEIFEHIRDFYNINFTNSFIVAFSRCVYNSTRQYYSIQNWENINKDELVLIKSAVKNKLSNESIVSKEIINLIEKNLYIRVSVIEYITLCISLNRTRISFETLQIKAFIICHGYATASSIADVCNKMTGKYVFNAVDMPFDTPISNICNQVRRILYYSDNRDIIFLVDLGSLENIPNILGEIPNINLGIMNNVCTSMALYVASSIIEGKSIREIFENESESYKTSYQIFEKSKREETIIFVSESGSEIAAKVSQLFVDSFPNNINVNILSYDYETFIELANNKGLEKYNVLFVASTVYLKNCKYPFISIEDIITFRNTKKLNQYLSNYLGKDDIQIFNQNILNSFSLQNVVESLTILNANKVLLIVNKMLNEIQKFMKKRFSAKTIIGLNIHISCLIERLVKKETINTHIDDGSFIANEKEFINTVKLSFKPITDQYNIQLPISEIAYIYDYIKHDKDENNYLEDNF